MNEDLKQFTLADYKILETGNDGGHRYIETQIIFLARERRMTVFFKSKLDEAKLCDGTTIIVTGTIQDDGEAFGLILREAQLEEE